MMYYKPEWNAQVKSAIINYLKSAIECPETVGRTKGEIVNYILAKYPDYSYLGVEVALDWLVSEQIISSIFIEKFTIKREIPENITESSEYVDIYYLYRNNMI